MTAVPQHLDAYLAAAAAQNPALTPVCQTVTSIAAAGAVIAKILARGPLAGTLSDVIGDSRDGDGQKLLDALTHDIMRDALAASPCAIFASEEADDLEILDLHAPLAVAVDPLDGSSNIETLAPVGTIFSILHATPVLRESFLQAGRHQLAAGFLIYGPRICLALTLGDGVRLFTLDPECGAFVTTSGVARIPETTGEYAINGANMRHWEPQIRGYVTELMLGAEGPRGKNFNTRWLASMVADAYRILIRGGIYLYPGDQRRGYGQGRLRLVYEANPIALLMEQAGGAATDGKTPILDIVPGNIHERCPLVFGAKDEVRRVAAAYEHKGASESPLFKTRSLFRKTAAGSLA